MVQAKTVEGDEGAVAMGPIGIQQVCVGVGAQVIVLSIQLFYGGLESGVTVEAAGEEKRPGDVVFVKGLCDHGKAVAEFVAGEDEGYGPGGGVASNDRAVGHCPMMGDGRLGMGAGQCGA